MKKSKIEEKNEKFEKAKKRCKKVYRKEKIPMWY